MKLYFSNPTHFHVIYFPPPCHGDAVKHARAVYRRLQHKVITHHSSKLLNYYSVLTVSFDSGLSLANCQ